MESETFSASNFDRGKLMLSFAFLSGLVLLVIGLIGILTVIVNPSHLIGSFFYGSIGLSFALYGGRHYLHSFLPPMPYKILYGDKRDLLEMILQSNSLYQIIGMFLFSVQCVREEVVSQPSVSEIEGGNDASIRASEEAGTVVVSPRYINVRTGIVSTPKTRARAFNTLPPYSETLSTTASLTASTTPLTPIRATAILPASSTPLDLIKCLMLFQPHSPSSTALISSSLEGKWEMLSELMLSVMWRFLEKQCIYYSKECWHWIIDEYQTQKRMLWENMMNMCKEQIKAMIGHLPLPFKPTTVRVTEDAVIALKTTKRDNHPVSPLDKIHQMFHDYNALLSSNKRNIISSFLLIEQYSRRRSSVRDHLCRLIVLSYLLLNIIAFKLRTLPHRIRWLQSIILRGLLTTPSRPHHTYTSISTPLLSRTPSDRPLRLLIEELDRR